MWQNVLAVPCSLGQYLGSRATLSICLISKCCEHSQIWQSYDVHYFFWPDIRTKFMCLVEVVEIHEN